MFTLNKCLVNYCNNHALSTFDQNGNLCSSDSYCLDHIPNPGKIKDDIYNYIATHDKIVGLNACGLIFSNIDFSNKKFFGCNFTNCTFLNIHSENLLLRMCFFDFAIFNDCNFIHSKNLFNSFSMATFTHTLYTSSDLVQNNFNGIKAYQCSFDDSDLLNSRFINATLVDLETAISKKQFFTIQTAQTFHLKCQTHEKHYLNQRKIKLTKTILNLEIPL